MTGRKIFDFIFYCGIPFAEDFLDVAFFSGKPSYMGLRIYSTFIANKYLINGGLTKGSWVVCVIG